MKLKEFQARDLKEVAANLLTEQQCHPHNRDEIAYRAIDRIIQRERRNKNINTTQYRRWKWIERQ